MSAAGEPLVPLLPTFLPVNRVFFVPRTFHLLDSKEFLQFARADFEAGESNGWCNALGNAKKAVTSRVDALLYASGLAKFAKDQQWSFRDRLSALAAIGYSTPSDLERSIVKPRNNLEHEYRLDSSLLELEGAINLAAQYLSNTEKYLELGVVRAVEFSSYVSHPRGGRLRKPRRRAVVLLFDYELNLLDCYSGRGEHAVKLFKDIGPRSMIEIFQPIVRKCTTNPDARIALSDEESFLRLTT
jgi:hypothetical protein